MSKINKVLAVLGVVAISVAPMAKAVDTIAWGNGAFKAYQSDTVTLLPGNASSSIGGFVQMIYLGVDGIYNGYVGSGTGVSGDDVVVATTWIGSGGMVVAGAFSPASFTATTAIGSKYEIRFFDNASSNYAGGAVPTSGYYGLSQVFTQAGDPNLGGTDSFSFNANYSTTTPVPEPSTVMLMLAGLGLVGMRKLRRS